MSRLHPLRAQELIAVLKKLGFSALRQKGSHIFFQHHDGRATVVPFHKGEDLGRGLVRKILRDVELTWEEFEKLFYS